jgi:predicted metalloprotease with PDZ domain
MIHLLLSVATLAIAAGNASPTSIAYALSIEPAHLDVVDVSITFRNAPESFHLATRVHGEYDAQYWRYIDAMRIESVPNGGASISREDSTLWRVSLPGGSGVVRYRVHVQPPPASGVRVWKPYVRADGAMINPPDFFLYSPELARLPVTLNLRIPPGWRVATALPSAGARDLRAIDASTLLDSPILVGNLHEWSFTEAGVQYHVAYWPRPNAVVFDTAAFVDGLHRLAHATQNVFGGAPMRDYWFLIEDGAGDALEHRASVTIGVDAARLARDPNTHMQEIAHEFFHTWNLVAIRPSGYNELSYRAGRRTPSLWIGEGITLYYADLLQRRARLADTGAGRSRLDHLVRLLERYFASSPLQRVSPTRSSLAFGDSPADNEDATGGYYLQGELLGSVLDAIVRDSTRDSRGLDDIMRVMFERSLTSTSQRVHGYSPEHFEAVADSVCQCRLDVFFAREVRGTGPIDLRPALAGLGFRLVIDSVPATDSAGHLLPDRRLFIDLADSSSARLVVRDSTAWARGGLRSGDHLRTIGGEPVHSLADFQRALARLGTPDSAAPSAVVVEIERRGRTMRVSVPVAGYSRPRVRVIDAPTVTLMERSRRDAWLEGS